MARKWLVAACAVLAIGGCGGDSEESGSTGETVCVYVHQNPQIVRAAQIALQEADGHAGTVRVELVPLVTPPDDPAAKSARAHAEKAVGDAQAVAFIGPQTSSCARTRRPARAAR